MDTISLHGCFGGTLGYYQHAAASTCCDMRFSVFLPAESQNRRLPVLWWLSGLTCTEDNFTVKAGAYRKAAERTFQVVTQAAGRAGRGSSPGRVLIQTWQPEHYALVAASRHDFLSFYRQESEFRRQLDYPPFCQLILLRFDGPNASRIGRAADEAGSYLRLAFTTLTEKQRALVLGPVPAPLAKIKNRYRLHILIKADPLQAAREVLMRELDALESTVKKANGHLGVDINPLSLM